MSRSPRKRTGQFPRQVADTYVWGDALDTLRRTPPDARIINLETGITTSDDFAERH